MLFYFSNLATGNAKLDRILCVRDAIRKVQREDLSGKKEISDQDRELIYSRNFLELAEIEHSKFEKFAGAYIKLRSDNISMAEMIHYWLANKCGSSICDDELFSLPVLICYTMDHRYRGKLLETDKKFQVTLALMPFLKADTKTSSEVSMFNDFKSSNETSIFRSRELNDLEPAEYWKTLKDQCPKLSQIGIMYVNIPASITPHCNNISNVHKDHAEMIRFIKNYIN